MLIENTILAQTKDKYRFTTVYKQECSIYSFSLNTLSNEQCYEQFITKIEFGSAIEVTRQHQGILSRSAEESNKNIYNVTS